LNSLHLKSFIRCKRKAWLDFKGKKSYKVWSPHKAIDKINQFQTFYEFCNSEIYTGLKACKNGYQGVIGLKIKGNLFQNINAEIRPQLLVKTKGKSKWGQYKYLPAVYKLGHKTTKEHLFDLAFCSLLLESFQESKIEKGLVISTFDKKVKVISTLGGSPAEEAGIESGDSIETVDGISSEKLGLASTASKLRGESGTKVLVEVSSKSGEIREVDLERRSVDLRPVRTKRLRDDSHTIGYLRITQFSESVPKKVEEALQELKEKEVEGLILDLRNNSGGLVSSGIAVADSLLSGKPVVETKDRNGIKDAIISQKETSFDGPMVTLVNKGTASASEILAGSLQDNERSILMGEQTYGKGLIQSLKSLGEDSGIAITVASYLTPKGNNIQGQGITPDKLLDLPDASDYGSADDKWVRNAELFLESLLEKDEVPVQTTELNNEEIKSLNG